MYEVLGRLIKGGFHTLPYNAIFCRVGGMGRAVNDDGTGRSFDNGLGLPVALFVRTANFGDLTALLRFRARLGSILGKDYVHGIPLLLIDPDFGTRVLTEKMQQKLLATMANSLNPFQNPHLEYKIQFDHVSEPKDDSDDDIFGDIDDYAPAPRPSAKPVPSLSCVRLNVLVTSRLEDCTSFLVHLDGFLLTTFLCYKYVSYARMYG